MTDINNLLLIYNEAFKDGEMGGTSRLRQHITALSEAGIKPHLLRGNYRESQAYYKKLDHIIPGTINSCSHWLYSSDNILKKATRYLLHRYWSAYLKKQPELEKSRIWKTQVNSSVYRDFDILWAVCVGSLQNLYTAHKIASDRCIPWVAVIHDPPENTYPQIENTDTWYEYKKLLDHAKYIITTSDRYREWLLAKTDLSPQKVSTLFKYFNHTTTALDEPSQEKPLKLSYAGRIHGGQGTRSLLPLLEAINSLHKSQIITTDNLNLTIAGDGVGYHQAVRYAKKNELSAIVNFTGIISEKEAQHLAASSDVNLLIQGENQDAQIPNKLFELMMTGKHILYSGPARSDIHQILISFSNYTHCRPTSVEDHINSLKLLISSFHEIQRTPKINQALKFFSKEKHDQIIRKIMYSCLKS